jgi:uncharacterized protein YdhG (YjbR/CyaY superfamily)
MPSIAKTPDEYIAQLPDDRQAAVSAIRDAVNSKLPKGFKECIGYGMIAWVVPHEVYPPGYHCNPKLPLGYMMLDSKKGHVALHSLSLYGSPELLEWFQQEWPKHTSYKLDMGKGCVRFKKFDDLPLDLITELASKLTTQQWIDICEKAIKR